MKIHFTYKIALKIIHIKLTYIYPNILISIIQIIKPTKHFSINKPIFYLFKNHKIHYQVNYQV